MTITERRVWIRAAAAATALLLLLIGRAGAQETGVIRGLVFVDHNANTLREADESGQMGVGLLVTTEGAAWPVTTGADGTFVLDVPLGSFQVTLQVPEGYSATNDTTRMVTLGSEIALEAVMEFGLSPGTRPSGGRAHGHGSWSG